MKKKEGLLVFLVFAFFLIVFFTMPRKENEEEIRATWISYIDFTTILWGKSEEEFRLYVDEMISDLQQLKLNTIYVHASAFTDAFYDSDYYPTSQFVSGKIGEPLAFDPFGIIVAEAKDAGFRVEAWINPLRSFSEDQMEQVPYESIQRQWLAQNNHYIVLYEGRYYFNPAYSEVHQLVTNVAVELVKKYDIDGVHMDDYFYPDKVSTEFDDYEYNQVATTMSLSEFRKENVNSLVLSIYEGIKAINSDVDFTISPAGNINYSTNDIYGDVKAWINDRIVDMVIPQIYFGYDHETLPFDECLQEWESAVEGTNVELVVGLGAYKINTIDPFAMSGNEEWLYNSDILARQLNDARNASNYKGFSLYSYHSIKHANEESIMKVNEQIENLMKEID